MAAEEEHLYIHTTSNANLKRIISKRRATMLDYESAGDNRAETVRPRLEAALNEKERREAAGTWDE